MRLYPEKLATAESMMSALLPCFLVTIVSINMAWDLCRRIVERVDKAEVVVDYANDIDTQM